MVLLQAAVGSDEAVVEVLRVALQVVPETHCGALRPHHGTPQPPEQLPHRRRRLPPPRLDAALPARPLPPPDAPRRV